MADETPATESHVGKQHVNESESVVGVAGTYENNKRETSVAAKVATFLHEPPSWYRRQAEEYVRQGAPERLLKPLASAVADHVLGNVHRWAEILPHVEVALREERRIGTMTTEERILGKFSRPRRERPSPGAESALVTNTTGAALGNTAREYALWGGGGDRNAALCRKKG